MGRPRHNASGTLIEAIQIWSELKPSLTVEEVKVLLAGCDYSERTKLYLLLCLNCGMYQNDIAELVLLCDFDIGGSCGSG